MTKFGQKLAVLITIFTCIALFERPANSVNKSKSNLTFGLIMPRFKGQDRYWDLVREFTQATCKDLNIKLKVVYAHNDAKKFVHSARVLIEDENVQAIIVGNSLGVSSSVLKVAEKARIPTLLIDNSIKDSERAELGNPREKLKYWLGEFIPDNVEAGHDLLAMMKLFLKKAQSERKKIEVLAIGGASQSGNSSKYRLKGLKLYANKSSDIIINTIQPAYWQAEPAKEVFLKAFQRFPNSSIVWAANDTMAMGVLAGVKELGLRPNQDIFLGGIDWTPEAIEAIHQQTMSVSIGGHYMLGGWATILLYDYFRGYDFAQESVYLRLRMEALTRDNIALYRQYFAIKNWDAIDFTRFSKALNPELNKYNFSLKAILEQLK